MYFAKYLKQLGWEPIVVTVDEKKASYAVLDTSLNQEVDNIRLYKTNTREPLQWYSLLTSGSRNKGIPQGEVNRTTVFRKIEILACLYLLVFVRVQQLVLELLTLPRIDFHTG